LLIKINAGIIEQITLPRPFSNINTLTFYVAANHGFPTTVLRYIGMQGEHTHYRRDAVHANYEVLCTGDEIDNANVKAAPGLNLGV
jgi:hypothetical protein